MRAGLIYRHPAFLALCAGGVSALGFQPFGLWPVTLLAVAFMIGMMARAESGFEVALRGWLFGVGHFVIGNFWIATAFTYQANMPHWLGFMAVVLLALYLAVWPMLAMFGAWIIARRCGALPWLGLLLVPLWIVTEWLRATVFTGFAWNPLGAVLLGGFGTPGLAALAPWIGTYGLSGVAVGLSFLIFVATERRAYLWLALTFVVAATGMMAPLQGVKDDAGGLAYTVVQPNIAQDQLDDPRFYEEHFARLAQLSESPRAGERRLVLWPESGLPDYLRDGYPQYFYNGVTYAGNPTLARERIAHILGPRSLLLTGGIDLAITGDKAVAARNVVTAIDDRGDITASYAKAHLVPYGEYLPLRRLLEPVGLSRLVPGAMDFLAGPGARTIDFGPWGRAGVQICYEIIFSGEVVERSYRPDFIFNPSNDGWFGDWGPPQHLAQARLRAIEEGLPVLRATTNGISAVIDAHGIVRKHLGRNVAGRLDGQMPDALPPTLFSQYGNRLPLGLAAVVLVITLVALRLVRHYNAAT